MAGGGGEHRQHGKGRHQRLLFVVEEWIRDRGCYVYLIIKINLKDMFASAVEAEDGEAAMWSFPSPMAELNKNPRLGERYNLAVVPGAADGTKIVAVSFRRHAFVYDTVAAAEVPCGPELRYEMLGAPALIPLGTRVYAVPHNLWPPKRDEQPSFQVLLPPAQRQRGGNNNARWSRRALPAPPPELSKQISGRGTQPFCFLTAFLAAGTRVWVSAPHRGTYSFDTARLAWRKEGDWELPFQERGLFVPEFGLCFGLCPQWYCLCAFDLPAAGQPPALRYKWLEETFPRECRDRGFHVAGPGRLAYLGDGKFCITCTVAIECDEQGAFSRFALSLMTVQVVRCSPREAAAAGANNTGELRLVRHKVRFYKMSPRGVNGYVLQPSLG